MKDNKELQEIIRNLNILEGNLEVYEKDIRKAERVLREHKIDPDNVEQEIVNLEREYRRLEKITEDILDKAETEIEVIRYESEGG